MAFCEIKVDTKQTALAIFETLTYAQDIIQ